MEGHVLIVDDRRLPLDLWAKCCRLTSLRSRSSGCRALLDAAERILVCSASEPLCFQDCA